MPMLTLLLLVVGIQGSMGQVPCGKLQRACRSQPNGAIMMSNVDEQFCVGVCLSNTVTEKIHTPQATIQTGASIPKDYGVLPMQDLLPTWAFNSTCQAFNDVCAEGCKKQGLVQDGNASAVYCMDSPSSQFLRYGACACGPYVWPTAFEPQHRITLLGVNPQQKLPAIPQTYQALEHLDRACEVKGGEIKTFSYTPYPLPDLGVCVTKGSPDEVIHIPAALPTWQAQSTVIQNDCDAFDQACSSACSLSSIFVSPSSNSSLTPVESQPLQKTFYSACTSSRKDGSILAYGQCLCSNGKIPSRISPFATTELTEDNLVAGDLIPFNVKPIRRDFFGNVESSSLKSNSGSFGVIVAMMVVLLEVF